jgi:hypothetical protein
MKNILLITTVYRVGEKIYPIIPKLSEKYNVHVLNMYQMSNKTPWVNMDDPRIGFYDMCEKYCSHIVHGPQYFHAADKDAEVNYRFVKKIDKYLQRDYYDLVIWDNNITIKGGQLNEIYKWFKEQDIINVGCPHGNKEIKAYRIHKRLNRLYDYSFVFGKKEKKALESISKGKLTNKLFTGGIPDNDKLKGYSRGNKYILIIPNFTDPALIGGQTSHFKIFTKQIFDELKIHELSKDYSCDIIIKEKLKLFYSTTLLKDSLKSYENVHCIDYHEDHNQLIADAICVIGASSTLNFKSIQMGIPSILLKGYGVSGNFSNYQGMIGSDPIKMRESIEKQEKDGKDINFITDTLEGGLDFNSTDVYVDRIDKIIGEVK